MAIVFSVAGVTVRTTGALTIGPNVAVMFVGPVIVAVVARPLEPAAFETVATATAEEAHVTLSVRSCVVAPFPASKKPVALNCSVVPLAIETVGVGWMGIDTSCAAFA